MKGSLPRRYARALIGIAREGSQIEGYGKELRRLVAVTERSPEILAALSSSSFESSDRLAAMGKISEHVGFSPMIRNFFLLLVEKNRIGLLPEIAREYQRFQDEILGIVRVHVMAPTVPTPAVLGRVEEILGTRVKKKVLAHGSSKSEMIGGLVLKVGHVVYDGSVQRELERMREMMLKV